MTTRALIRFLTTTLPSIALLAGAPAWSADLAASVEEAFALRGLSHTAFDARRAHSPSVEQARFLTELFASADEVVLLNANAAPWFLTQGAKGLHPADYAEQIDELLERFRKLETPVRVESVRDYISESLRLQRDFLAEWHQANESGRPFVSQLTDEFAYHEGLHRSQRLLLKAFAELRALFPDADDGALASFRGHLHAMNLK